MKKKLKNQKDAIDQANDLFDEMARKYIGCEHEFRVIDSRYGPFEMCMKCKATRAEIVEFERRLA